MPELVLKILTCAEWSAACEVGQFAGSAVDLADGFIHLSSPTQVAATAARHFRGQNDLVLVAFEAAALGPALKWEVSRGGDRFPHLYAPLPCDQAVWMERLPLDADGRPVIPEQIRQC